jgi:Na+-transporting NADH:ubiquinone oxidoreductase subunit A
LDLPIAGASEPVIEAGSPVTRVALLTDDFPGLKPGMEVQVGDQVRIGQRLFHDKTAPAVSFAAPVAGQVVAINRGKRRKLLSVVIEMSPQATRGRADETCFDSFTAAPPESLSAEDVGSLLLEAGLWTAFRTRPYSRIPEPGSAPSAIFVTAMDTHPLAPDPEVVLRGREEHFAVGLRAVSRLTPGRTYLCTRGKTHLRAPAGSEICHERFDGPHPAGVPGTHIHRLDPVHREKIVWHLGYQDVAAIGTLFTTGCLDTSRVIALAGPGFRRPRLVRTHLGARISELVEGELAPGRQRIIAGSVLGGHRVDGDVTGYLGRYHNQVCALPEGDEREMFGWLKPGARVFSVTNAFLSALIRPRSFDFTTTTNGSVRPMVPIGTYERIMPMDIEPTYLLRSLITGDLELAEQLGCLELDEEDVALATFVCPGKYNYGPLLRKVLDRIREDL